VRILLDENIAHKLRAHLSKHETMTVAHLGWNGLKNGELLKAAEDAGFDVLVTGDQALPDQQNISAIKLAIVVLSAHDWNVIKKHVGRIINAVDLARPGAITRVDVGAFLRRRRPPGPPA
jgi:predicted nuclease of predicted toxin-antitoxin system